MVLVTKSQSGASRASPTNVGLSVRGQVIAILPPRELHGACSWSHWVPGLVRTNVHSVGRRLSPTHLTAYRSHVLDF